MRKKQAILCGLAVLAFLLPAPAQDPAALIPDLEGWSRDGKTESFVPDDLYEHIDGAAENFLAYGFVRLAVQNYVNADKQAISAEVYFHGTPENAFGIYGSEKPLAGNYLAIGAEGYEEEGVLNFISGPYYVKLNGFDLGPGGAGTLRALAEKIARAIGSAGGAPPAWAVFPARGRIAHSERYFASNFLGLDFLGAAFSADYEADGRRFKLFFLRGAGTDDARERLVRWAALDKGFAGKVKPGSLALNDPYNGPVRLLWQGGSVVGAIGEVGGDEINGLLQELAGKLARQ